MTDQGMTIRLRGRDGRILSDAAGRATRLRATHTARWQSARTPLARFAVGADYLRAAAAAVARGGRDPSEQIERAARAAWIAGETLVRELAETGGRDV